MEGKVQVSGNKNSIFPCVGAAILTNDEVILENVPNLKDTKVLLQILGKLGVQVERVSDKLFIKAAKISQVTIPANLMIKLRGSIVLVGALLSRMGKVNFYHPGGDVIGRRSIQTHLDALISLGALLKREGDKFRLKFPQDDQNHSYDIFLQEASVTATENLILASVLGKRKVVVRNCAKEPHIVDLCKMLLKMGAKIEGVGGDQLTILGVDKLRGTNFKLGVDYIEVGTYTVAAAITGGCITIAGLDDTDLNPLLLPFKKFGISIEKGKNSINVYAERLKSVPTLTTNIWPGFPTDLMSVAIVLATQSKGATLCHDWMYESRMFFTDKLISMGANISLADPHRCIVSGPTKLKGRVLETPDIRAGMALVLASLVAKGVSIINQAELIERGYENVCEKLKSLGADIERII